jgi:signal transduction histidine kinase
MPFTLRQLLGGMYLISLVLLTSGVMGVVGHHLRSHFQHELLEHGQAIAQRLAEDSRIALIQLASDNIQPRLETIAAYPNVVGVVVMTPKGQPLAHAGSDPITPDRTFFTQTGGEPLRVIENHRSITLLAAVRSSPDPRNFFRPRQAESTAAPLLLGFVAVTLTKARLQANLESIHQHILIVMLLGAVLVTGIMLYALRQITYPIQQLARVMSDPATVAHFRCVEARGVQEAQTIGLAFNQLITQVAQTHQALIAHRADLARQVEAAVREVKQQNVELAQARAQAEAASSAKSQFIAHMSHELRTPLHGLKGLLTLLEKTPLSDKQRSFLILMREDADRLLREINSILDFSQAEAHRLILQERTCNLKRLLAYSVKAFKARAEAKRLRLTLTLDPALPNWVRVDDQQLEKILRNLIDNAIKFTLKGHIQIRAGGRPADGEVFLFRCCIRDRGIGIPHEQQTSIFKPFTQADSSTTRRYGGSGLGLAIAWQLIRLMNGRIKLKSHPGKGSLFCIDLPLPLPHAETVVALPEPEGEGHSPRQALMMPPDEPISERPFDPSLQVGHRCVLVVDDDRQSRLYAQFTLLELNAKVITAPTGEAALAACARQRFDLILMDIRMPDMDGLETTRRLRQQRAGLNTRTPIIGLTADVLNLDQQDWQAAGMDACHHKPLEPEHIADLFRRWGIGQRTKTANLPDFLRTYYAH